MSNRTDSDSADQAADSFFGSLVWALHDYFNPLLHAIDDIQYHANKNRKE